MVERRKKVERKGPLERDSLIRENVGSVLGCDLCVAGRAGGENEISKGEEADSQNEITHGPDDRGHFVEPS